uniref:DUF1899 domain-containing protein n=1 Tax=Panagrolaimus sp. PS1159 TaxID=55785 RepID=A0AC35GIZ7_9BILA
MSAHLNYPKKEATIFDMQISSTSTSHNSIESGTELFAFQATSDPGRLAVLPLNVKGRVSMSEISHVFVSSTPLTDFKFLKYPSDQDILVASNRAGNIKLFALKEINNGPKFLNSPDLQFNACLGAVETLASHKSVSNFFAVGGDQGWAAYDATNGQEVVGGKGNGPIKAIDWNTDGNQIAVLQTSEKNRISSVIDARSKNVVLEYEAHNSFGRECRVIHGGKYIISSGFNQNRFQEIVVYDTIAGKMFMRQQYDKSISFLIPAYDEDTKLLFLGAKGSTLIRHVDVTNIDVASLSQLNCPSQTIGFCLSPKLKCDVMSAQVQKVYQLHSGGIAPIPCNVIRRSYIEYHEELYPETAGLESGGTIEDWKSGNDVPVKKINLRPVNAPVIGYIGVNTNKSNKHLKNLKENYEKEPNQAAENIKSKKVSSLQNAGEKNVENKTNVNVPVVEIVQPKAEEINIKLREAPPPRSTTLIASQVASRLYQSRSPYYNIKAVTSKSKTISDVRDINSRISSDGIFFTACGKYAAVALSKIEGSVAIYDLDISGRTPEGCLDAVFNKAQIMDLQFDPFNNEKILCALANGRLKLWDISDTPYCTNRVPNKAQPEPGMRNVISEEDTKHLTLSKLTPLADISCQVPKVVIARYNPIVQNLVAVAGSDGTILVINLENAEELFKTKYHKSAIVSLSWSNDGMRLITVDRDSLFVLSDIRKENDGITVKKEFKSKSPRAIFTGHIGNEFILVTYLQGSLHKWSLMDLNLNIIKEEELGSSQGNQSLRPFYDYDTGIFMMASKSSPCIFMSQVTSDGFIQDILQTTLTSPHQAIALLPKNVVDCEAIEIIRVVRLTNNSIEIIPFVVPRREKNLFLRELYPLALVTWKPSMKLDEWLSHKNLSPKYFDLKPDSMTEMPFERDQTALPQLFSRKTNISYSVINMSKENVVEINDKSIVNVCPSKTLDLKKTEIAVMQGWSDVIPVDKDSTIPQDNFQGVEDDEWEEIVNERC